MPTRAECDTCGKTIAVRANGKLYPHNRVQRQPSGGTKMVLCRGGPRVPPAGDDPRSQIVALLAAPLAELTDGGWHSDVWRDHRIAEAALAIGKIVDADDKMLRAWVRWAFDTQEMALQRLFGAEIGEVIADTLLDGWELK